jgi:protein subunit release factor A
MKDFTKTLYPEVKQLFPEGAVQVLVARSKGPGSVAPVDPTIKLVHITSGTSITCDDYASQTKNFITAMVRLRIACDKLGLAKKTA